MFSQLNVAINTLKNTVSDARGDKIKNPIPTMDSVRLGELDKGRYFGLFYFMPRLVTR